MTPKLAIAVLLSLTFSACTRTQTGEGEPAPKCRDQSAPIAADERTPIGIVPMDFFAKLRTGDTVYEVKWGADASVGDAVAVTFSQLGDQAQFVVAHAEDGTDEAACPDFVSLALSFELRSVQGDTFAESLRGSARVFQDETGSIVASTPKEDLRGTFDTGPAGNPFERMNVRLRLGNGVVSELLITAESDAQNRTPEIVAVWP
jgi:hypothetical protein